MKLVCARSLCRVCWQMTNVSNVRQSPVICLSVHVKTCSFLRTLWQVTSPGSTGTTRRQNSNRQQWKGPTSPRPKKGRQVRSKTKVMLLEFFDSEGIVHHEYAPDRQTINKEFYVEVLRRLCESVRRKDRKNGGMATGSCTTTMRPHTLHILCNRFWPNTAPLSWSSRHTHQISHRVSLSYSQGLRKFWKNTDLRQRRTSNEIRPRHYV